MNVAGESLSQALARRTLMQRYDGPDTEGAEDDAARQLHRQALEMSRDGSSATQIQVTRALVSQQVLAADDVAQLWPHAPQMQIAAAQMTAKANAYAGPHLGEEVQSLHGDANSNLERNRERFRG